MDTRAMTSLTSVRLSVQAIDPVLPGPWRRYVLHRRLGRNRVVEYADEGIDTCIFVA